MSKIFGQINANGKVMLLDAVGIYFGPTAHINVGSLVATTANINNDDFMKGNYHFTPTSSGAHSVINAGEIHAASGLVALVAPAVANTGLIEANLGKVVLAAGNEYTLDLYGDQMINFALNDPVRQTSIDQYGHPVRDAVVNSGTIIADGGKILLTANVAQNVVQNVINMSGVAQATSVSQHAGEIILDGGTDGTVEVSGRFDATGKASEQHGGTVKILGNNLNLTHAQVDVSGANGGGTVLIGGNQHGAGAERNATTTTLDAATSINASALQTGDGGNIVVWSNEHTKYAGHLSATGGSAGGNGGTAEVSGKALLNYTGSADLSATAGNTGTLLLDPHNITISNSGSTTGGMSDDYVANTDSSNILISDLTNALTSANVILQTGTTGAQAGDITIANALNLTSSNTLTLLAARNININAPVTSAAANAGLILHADANGTGTGTVNFNSSGSINFSGNAANIELYYNPSSYTSPTDFSSKITTSGSATATEYMLVNDLTDLQNISTNLAGTYALGRDIDASATQPGGGVTFTPLGNFSGTLNGDQHVIDDLTINTSEVGDVGLFNQLGANGVLENIGLVNVDINAVSSSDLGATVGSFAGYDNGGTLRNIFVTGNVSSLNTSLDYQDGYGLAVGGLVGFDYNGTIENSYSNANVISTVDKLHNTVGGLVGISYGNLTNIYSSGNISAQAIGTPASAAELGGLIGSNFGTINKAYTVSALSTNYSSVFSGALAGRSNNNSINASFWNSTLAQTTMACGSGICNGATNISLADLTNQNTYSNAGWDFNTIWSIAQGHSTPFFQWRYATVSGQVQTPTNTPVGNQTVEMTQNGQVQTPLSSFDMYTDGTDFTISDSNGNYSLLFNSTEFDNYTPAFVYIASGTQKSNTLTTLNSASTRNPNVNLYTNTVSIQGFSNDAPASLADLTAAIGAQNPTQLLFATSANNLNLAANTNYLVSAPYEMQGAIVANNGALAFQNSVTLTDDTNLSSGGGDITFGGTLNGTFDLTLNAANGNIVFAAAAGSLNNRLGALQISSANNVTVNSALDVQSFNQIAGSGTTDFGSTGVDAQTTVDTTANYIQGTIVANGQATLIGAGGLNAYVEVGALTVGGTRGGMLMGTVNGITGMPAARQVQLTQGARGTFMMNGQVIGSPLTIYNVVIPVINGATPEQTDSEISALQTSIDTVTNSLLEIDNDNLMAQAARAICS